MIHGGGTPRPLQSLTPAAMLMAVLDVMESKAMVESIEEHGGAQRPHGVRPMLWEVRYNLTHATPDNGTWFGELEHAVTHVMAAGDAAELQAALRVTAALAASWALTLEVQTAGGES